MITIIVMLQFLQNYLKLSPIFPSHQRAEDLLECYIKKVIEKKLKSNSEIRVGVGSPKFSSQLLIIYIIKVPYKKPRSGSGESRNCKNKIYPSQVYDHNPQNRLHSTTANFKN